VSFLAQKEFQSAAQMQTHARDGTPPTHRLIWNQCEVGIGDQVTKSLAAN
jgi:hypothetical protein